MVNSFCREIREYFTTMLGYIFIGMFMLLTGVFFVVNNVYRMSADFSITLNDCVYIFMITSPLLTMRLIAEERKNRRDQLLLTVKTSIQAIVFGKFFAALFVYTLSLIVSLIYPAILSFYGNVAFGKILSGYIGLFLLGSTFLATGILVSSFVENQLTAAIGTYATIIMVLVVEIFLAKNKIEILTPLLRAFTIFDRFENFQFGVLSLSSVVYYISLSLLLVYCSACNMESRRYG